MKKYMYYPKTQPNLNTSFARPKFFVYAVIPFCPFSIRPMKETKEEKKKKSACART